ncbi:Quinone oxidoreductase (NADPH:quinone reductase) [Legionella donaldsonii]|uniref:Quinone oxidoreductase (NADPH:quinone reductase) n=1 Tax=Legionella donaldsonii TaxID=45060 RepID=A0A378J1V5_9GAMM|nr:zinc-dependent alcohol dehydrogenase family protein [Legionella donaldsonii]STX41258.1 Quinone oxidoreductase (NADPH:quinone reductase) [Legionella donaldsonii]
MRSIVLTKFGDIDVFAEATLPKPEIKPGHVLIKVVATSVNPLDYKMRKGYFPDLVKSFPMVLHGDVAGIIEEVGEGVTDFSVGDEVYGCVGGLLDMGGGLAEYVLADADLIALKPKTLSLIEAASLPLVSLTAWEGLVTYAKVKKGQTVLIHGGTGGVGHISIQLAKWLGAKVFATGSSAKKLEMAKQLGADFAIDYKKTTIESYVAEHTNGAGFEIVFDTVGGENFSECFQAAALFGQVISILAAGNYDLSPAFFKGLSIHLVLQPLPLITGIKRAHYGEILAKIATLVDEGFIRPLIDEQKFNITQVEAAHAHLENGNALGKIVLTNFA